MDTIINNTVTNMDNNMDINNTVTNMDNSDDFDFMDSTPQDANSTSWGVAAMDITATVLTAAVAVTTLYATVQVGRAAGAFRDQIVSSANNAE